MLQSKVKELFRKPHENTFEVFHNGYRHYYKANYE